MRDQATKMRECPRCLFTEDIAKIGEEQCEYCDLHDQMGMTGDELQRIIYKIQLCSAKYNCLIGISGGQDSAELLYAAVRWWGLRPLVIHFDNHWNTEAAKDNMRELITTLGVDSITYTVNKEEYDQLCRAFVYFGLPDADIPNDIAMTKLMYDTAERYGIKYILNGHDFRTEGSTPRDWTYMDGAYIRDVYRTFARKELQNFPVFTFWDQIRAGIKGIKQVRPFHSLSVDRKVLAREMKGSIIWTDYGHKHAENIYTEFIGGHYLPKYFDIDKRRVYLSAQIRSGYMTKEQARIVLLEKFDKAGPLGINLVPVYRTLTRTRFARYNFKRWRLVVWVLWKLGVVPVTFYRKYAC